MTKFGKAELRVYERTPTNAFHHIATVPNQDAWEQMALALKVSGKDYVLVEGSIVDSTYKEQDGSED